MPASPLPLELAAVRLVLDALADAALLLDVHGKILHANPAFARLAGGAPLEAVGLDFADVVDMEHPPAALEAIVAGQSPARLECAVRSRDGAALPCPCEFAFSPLPGGGTVALARDLSAHRRALAALAAERDRYLGFLETAPLGIMALDSVVNGIVIADARRPNLPIIYANAAFERLSGYAAEEALGRPIGFLHAQDADQAAISRALTERRECRLELRGVGKDGLGFWHELALFPISDAEGKLTHYLGIHSDITERKAIQSELERLTFELGKHRDDLLSVLDQFPAATLIVDADGRIVFASASSRNVLAIDPEPLRNRPWHEALPFGPAGAARLRECGGLPPDARCPVELAWTDAGGARRWAACRIQDDPRDPARRLFIFEDSGEVQRLREQLETGRHDDLIGASEAMRRLYRLIGEVARGDWTVLIEGETGTGKELVARAVHNASPRKDRPFVAVNAAGLSESLLTSQLFGHRRGAFTGATHDQAGYFEAAHGGTLFLDEIGDLPLPMQSSLLRALQEREITRLGETRARKVDVRVIAASHRNLAEEAKAGRFREDLLFRLRVARLNIPPLRERKTDIPLLAESFLREARKHGKAVESFEPAALRAFLAYHWPGNVRELRACVEYAIIHSQPPRIGLADLPPELHAVAGSTTPVIDAADEPARILAALRHTGGNCTQAAQLLGISRATFYRRLQQHGLQAER